MHKKSAIARVVTVSVLVGVVLIGALFIGLNYTKQRITDRLLGNYAAQEQLVGKEVSSTLGVKAEDYFEDLRLMATNPAINQTRNPSCTTALSQFAGAITVPFESIARIGTDGTYFCALDPSLNGKNVSSFGANLTDTLSLREPKRSISGLLPSLKKDGEFSLMVTEPVYSNGRFNGYISASINLNDFMNDYLATIKFANTGFVSVQDANHDILYSHFTNNIGLNFYSNEIQGLFPNHGLNDAVKASDAGQSSIVRYTREDVKKIASIQPFDILPGTRWNVVVTVPEAEVGELFINPVLNNAFSIVLVGASIVILMAIIFVMIYILHEQELLRAKSQFVSLTSHQLRTPLTAVSLFSEMLEDPELGPLTDIQRDYAEKIRVSTARMIKLVGNILNVSRVELKRLNIEPEQTDIVAFVKGQVGEVAPLAEQKGVTLTVNPGGPAPVMIDQTLFAQIVHNLLTNAIRYSPSKTGEVTVGLLQTHKGIVLSVADNGIGIPKSDRRKIFNQFYRAENAKRAEGEGTGLGLFLVHGLAEMTGCTVTFEANKPTGTVFYVTIPHKGMRAVHGDTKLN